MLQVRNRVSMKNTHAFPVLERVAYDLPSLGHGDSQRVRDVKYRVAVAGLFSRDKP